MILLRLGLQDVHIGILLCAVHIIYPLDDFIGDDGLVVHRIFDGVEHAVERLTSQSHIHLSYLHAQTFAQLADHILQCLSGAIDIVNHSTAYGILV